MKCTMNDRIPNGIKNIGNTCFLNSVLQCLASSDVLDNVLSKFKDNSSFAQSLHNIIHEINLPTMNVLFNGFQVNPTTLYEDIISRNPSLTKNDEEDAHELLDIIFNSLIDDIDEDSAKSLGFLGLQGSQIVCRICKYERPLRFQQFSSISLTLSNDLSRLSLSSCLLDYLNEEIIENVSCPRCTQRNFCRRLSSAESNGGPDDICDSSVISDDTIAKSNNSQLPLSSMGSIYSNIFKNVDVQGISDSWFLDLGDDSCVEVLNNEFQWAKSCYGQKNQISNILYQSNILTLWRESASSNNQQSLMNMILQSRSHFVKCQSSISKKAVIGYLPSLLCLHIGRKMYSPTTGRAMKINKHVKFPLKLDMSPYLNRGTSKSIEYGLISMIVHHGGPQSGHYTAFRIGYRHGKKVWFSCSDSSVEEVHVDKVLSSPAYMLFYEKINDPLTENH